MEKSLLALDVDQFLVSPWLDVDEHMIGGAAGWNGHDRRLHSLELTAAILRDDDVGMRGQTIRGDQQQQSCDGNSYSLHKYFLCSWCAAHSSLLGCGASF